MANSYMLFDVFQWIYIFLRALVLLIFTCYSLKSFKFYRKFKDTYHKALFTLVIFSIVFEIVARLAALIGVEVVHGESYGTYISEDGRMMNDALMCSFNLSIQLPSYAMILALLVNLMKWVQLAILLH